MHVEAQINVSMLAEMGGTLQGFTVSQQPLGKKARLCIMGYSSSHSAGCCNDSTLNTSARIKSQHLL